MGGPCYLLDRGVADASCRIVDHTFEGFFVIRIDDHSEIGQHILDFLALIEAQPSIDSVRDGLLAHFFFKTSALGISPIEDGKIGIFATVFSFDAFDVFADDGCLLLV